MSSRSSALALLAFVSSTFAIPQHYAPAPIRPTGVPSGVPYPAGNSTGIWGTASGAYPPTGYPSGPIPSGPIGGPSSPVAVASSYGTPGSYSPPAGSPSAAALGSTCVSEVTSTVTNRVTVTVTAGSSPAGAEQSGHSQTTVVSQVTVSPVPVTSSPAGYSVISSAPAVSSPVIASQSVSVAEYSGASSTPIENSPVASSTPATYSIPAVSTSVYSSAASTPTSSGSSGSTSGKRGAAYNDATLVDAFANSVVSWAYDWSFYGSSSLPSSIEYVPMMWGLKAPYTQSSDGFNDTVSSMVESGSINAVLGFNEPDMMYSSGGQADMTPQQCADNWGYLEQFAGKVKIGSPAVTNGQSPMGTAFLQSFYEACSGCTVDFSVVHWYGDVDYSASTDDQIASIKQLVEDTAALGKPVWVTELAPNNIGSDEQMTTFIKAAMEYLDGHESVERYAYYWVAEGSLVSGGALSAIGEAYAA